jgi:2-polyprenyl-3-methyl-5-hydroxy-6-metoxy-1,4-benzoquinol methylase
VTAPVTSGGVDVAAAAIQFESVPCNLCGADDVEVVIPSQRPAGVPVDLKTVFRSSGDEPLQDRLVRCRRCGLHYVTPRLRPELILEGYQGATDEGFASQAAQRERTFGRCLDRIAADAPPPGRRVLDVGAASGSFLAEAQRRGYEVSGCEPSEWMCRFAREHYGITIEPATLFDLRREDGSLDLLTMWDVLEHTTDPTAVLRRAHALLAPGGVLALTVPDYGSWAARIMGRRWVFLLTVHLYYFTRDTIDALLRRCGFEPVKYRPHFQTLEMGYVAMRAQPYLGPLGGVGRKVVHGLGLDRAPFIYNVGQTMVTARKIERPGAGA